jgi:hypothetical protein
MTSFSLILPCVRVVKVLMKAVGDIVEDVKFISTRRRDSVDVVE